MLNLALCRNVEQNGVVSPQIINLSTGWRVILSFLTLAVLSLGREPWNQLDRDSSECHCFMVWTWE